MMQPLEQIVSAAGILAGTHARLSRFAAEGQRNGEMP
jgi:hypothetical protein